MCGGNDYGDLADGTTTMKKVPAYLPNQYNTGAMTGIRKVFAGQYMTGVLKADGTLWIGGYNNYGQSGIGSTKISRLLTQVKAPSGSSTLNNIIDVDMAYHVMAISADLELYTWGYNAQGQLGRGNTTYSKLPILIDLGDEEVVYVSAGNTNSLAVTASGKVYTWGTNNYGQLGIGNTTAKTSFVRVYAENGVDYLKDVISIAADNCHMAAVLKDGSVYAWGYNGYGQLRRYFDKIKKTTYKSKNNK